MEFKTRTLEKFTIIDLSEDISFEASLELKDILKDLYKKKNINIGINLSKVSHIGSQAIGVFIYTKKLLEYSGGSLFLIAPNKTVREIINKNDLGRFIIILNDESGLVK